MIQRQPFPSDCLSGKQTAASTRTIHGCQPAMALTKYGASCPPLCCSISARFCPPSNITGNVPASPLSAIPDLPLGESSRSEAFNSLRPIHPHREDRRDRSGGVALKNTIRRGLVTLNIASKASYGLILRSRGLKSYPSGVQGFRPQWVGELTPEVAIPIPSIQIQRFLPLTPQEHS